MPELLQQLAELPDVPNPRDPDQRRYDDTTYAWERAVKTAHAVHRANIEAWNAGLPDVNSVVANLPAIQAAPGMAANAARSAGEAAGSAQTAAGHADDARKSAQAAHDVANVGPATEERIGFARYATDAEAAAGAAGVALQPKQAVHVVSAAQTTADGATTAAAAAQATANGATTAAAAAQATANGAQTAANAAQATANGAQTAAAAAQTTANAALALVPRGCIMIWAYGLDSLPSGWALCDGQNGTPDLRGFFVFGAGTSPTYHVTGHRGGGWHHSHRMTFQTQHTTLGNNEMQWHQHGTYDGFTTIPKKLRGGADNPEYNPAHRARHRYTGSNLTITDWEDPETNRRWGKEYYQMPTPSLAWGTLTTPHGATWGHGHNIDHWTQDTNHMPPFVTLAYIMKL